MKRRSFIKRIGLAATATVVAPTILLDPIKEPQVLGSGLLEQVRTRGVTQSYVVPNLAEMERIIRKLNSQGDCKSFAMWTDLSQRLEFDKILSSHG